MKFGNVELSRQCKWCAGDGHIFIEEKNDVVQCGECNGRGMLLTDEGDNLIRFLKKFFEPAKD
jgi:DnaJ-class molecular chaperone